MSCAITSTHPPAGRFGFLLLISTAVYNRQLIRPDIQSTIVFEEIQKRN